MKKYKFEDLFDVESFEKGFDKISKALDEIKDKIKQIKNK
jgi:hypothetical protein